MVRVGRLAWLLLLLLPSPGGTTVIAMAIVEKLLSTRDLLSSKTSTIRARKYDPRLNAFNHILAVADTLLIADNPHPNWYSILQLPHFTTRRRSAQSPTPKFEALEFLGFCHGEAL